MSRIFLDSKPHVTEKNKAFPSTPRTTYRRHMKTATVLRSPVTPSGHVSVTSAAYGIIPTTIIAPHIHHNLIYISDSTR